MSGNDNEDWFLSFNLDDGWEHVYTTPATYAVDFKTLWNWCSKAHGLDLPSEGEAVVAAVTTDTATDEGPTCTCDLWAGCTCGRIAWERAQKDK